MNIGGAGARVRITVINWIPARLVIYLIPRTASDPAARCLK